MSVIEYKGRFYSRLKTHDDQGVLIEHVGLTQADVSEINKQHDWNVIRQKRDLLISETDWTQVSDNQLAEEKKAEFIAYRQELRDIPQNFDDPDAVVWPEKPTL